VFYLPFSPAGSLPNRQVFQTETAASPVRIYERHRNYVSEVLDRFSLP
jgi:hypothetical protein